MLIGACGGSADEPTAQDATTEPPASSGVTTDATADATTDATTVASEPADSSPATGATEPPSTPTTSETTATSEPSASSAPATTDPPVDTTAATTTPATTTTEPSPLDDECSVDGSPTDIAVPDAPPPDLPVAAASGDSPFPELAVRRLNCAPAWVQLSNEIPAATPVLAWFWAPH